MQTLIKILSIVFLLLYIMSPRQRKIIANLILEWTIGIVKWLFFFFIGFWSASQLLDTEFVSTLLTSEKTEQTYQGTDPSDESDDEDAADDDQPSPEADEDIPDEEDESDEEDEFDEEESLPQPTRAYS
jgi:hypothetical protein